ncbi:MAG TPA: hypothetical protein VEB64_16195 [Azospirillaceae bacterium]|nr:hypothetical protein [Azospirillaceae bacterium]
MSMKIAIVGLGRVGSDFLEELMRNADKGFQIVYAAETSDTEGKKLACDKGIPVGTIEDILALGDKVDIIFDLTGSRGVRRMVREELEKAGNIHTTVVPETVSRMMWALMTDKKLPEVHHFIGHG